jgi:hypothetical protein
LSHLPCLFDGNLTESKPIPESAEVFAVALLESNEDRIGLIERDLSAGCVVQDAFRMRCVWAR